MGFRVSGIGFRLRGLKASPGGYAGHRGARGSLSRQSLRGKMRWASVPPTAGCQCCKTAPTKKKVNKDERSKGATTRAPLEFRVLNRKPKTSKPYSLHPAP